ncbi:hypothetical protein RUM44_011448 [Polyplax serrata]|uniref:ADAMTS cysteine-rich domain-containing protein n=1 Tax=Polyplax serrata TaxID=468196 RepID=A0ABR1ARL4_POLSC
MGDITFYGSIGMHHDSTGNNCPKEGYIMSPSRGTNGETLWSSCSANIMRTMGWAKCLEDAPSKPAKKLDHTKYGKQPGVVWGAKKQCEVLLRDSDAEIYNPAELEGICENLRCKTPHRSGFYFAGPALEGTSCGDSKSCRGGKCATQKKKPTQNVVKGGWSNWTNVSECSSACIQRSKGFMPRRRTCTNPKPVNTDEGCEGSGYEVVLCTDDKLCKNKRQKINEFASKKCKQFSKLLPELDKNASGLQATYESDRLWMSCAIFCRRKNSNSYYTPRFELNDLNEDPYFPDGTWCHSDGKINHYCVQHHCLPENFKLTKGILPDDDLLLPQNAKPNTKPASDNLLKYFSIDLNKTPLLKILKPESEEPKDDDDEWFDEDYIEIPGLDL